MGLVAQFLPAFGRGDPQRPFRGAFLDGHCHAPAMASAAAVPQTLAAPFVAM